MLKSRLQKNAYMKDLKEQMKVQQNHKVSGFEMDEREKQLNKLNLKQVIKNNPDRYKRKAAKIELEKSRNSTSVQKAQTVDIPYLPQQTSVRPPSTLQSINTPAKLPVPASSSITPTKLPPAAKNYHFSKPT